MVVCPTCKAEEKWFYERPNFRCTECQTVVDVLGNLVENQNFDPAPDRDRQRKATQDALQHQKL